MIVIKQTGQQAVITNRRRTIHPRRAVPLQDLADLWIRCIHWKAHSRTRSKATKSNQFILTSLMKGDDHTFPHERWRVEGRGHELDVLVDLITGQAGNGDCEDRSGDRLNDTDVHPFRLKGDRR